MQKDKILFLSNDNTPLLSWLKHQGENVVHCADVITENFIKQAKVTYLVSYGYRHIIPKNIIDLFPNRAINLHISFLPWNRGADPNLWSFIEDTPKGVTIHMLDEGIDTGDIIIQKEIVFNTDSETLATTYYQLHNTIQELFKTHWFNIKSGKHIQIKQIGSGSYHNVKDKIKLSLQDGWNTKISTFVK